MPSNLEEVQKTFDWNQILFDALNTNTSLKELKSSSPDFVSSLSQKIQFDGLLVQGNEGVHICCVE